MTTNANMILVAVLDHAVGAFSMPFADQSRAAAIRNFSDSVNDGNPKNMWFKHPEDYSLYIIGEFNMQTGVLNPLTHEKLVTAASVRQYDRPIGSTDLNARSPLREKLPPEVLDTVKR